MNYLVGGYLIGLSIEDIKKQKLTIWMLLIFLVGGIAYGLMHIREQNLFLSIVPGMLLCALALQLPNSVGIGDGLLAIAYGSVYGWRKTCIWLMISFLLAAVFGLVHCFRRHRKDLKVPFVPFLAIVHVGMCL